MRKFDITYFEYDRHDELSSTTFHKVGGNSLLAAVNKLPDNILADVYGEVDGVKDDRPKTDVELLQILQNIDIGGFSYLVIKEHKDGQVFTHVDFGDDSEDEDQEW